MSRQPVQSTMLASVGYDPVAEVLELEFRTGDIYQYAEVDEDIYRELIAAESMGEYFLVYIDDQYPFSRIDEAG